LANTQEILERFHSGMKRAEASGLYLPNAMSLATVTAQGRPQVRVVLLKHADERGFVFYTNLGSGKSVELRGNPAASLCFWWGPIEEQIRIDGSVELVDDDEADAYFATRPRGSQLAAWASRQSAALESRDTLMAEFDRLSDELEGVEVKRPEFWSGYRLLPERFEFWYGREDRLHERIEYRREGEEWNERLLQP